MKHVAAKHRLEFASAQSAADEVALPKVSRRWTGRKRRWTINGDFAALKATGVARYAREVAKAIDALVGEGHPLTRDLSLDVVAPQNIELTHIQVRVVPEFRSPRLPQAWVQAQLPWRVDGGLVSFCNLAPIAIKRHIACIHDLHTFLMPESYGRGFRLAHRAVLPLLGRRAARITTVSNLSRQHLIEHGVAAAGKIVVTYNGSDHANRWDPGKASIDIGTERPFILCLGREQKYKNCALIWKIADRLDRLGIDVVMAGEIDPQARRSFASENPGNVRFLGRISDDSLAYALSRALCFVFPSRIEGFGLPAIEAMAHGCPLVASTSPCLPEVCGDAALFAGPDDADGWVAAIQRIRLEEGVASDLASKGRRQAQKYSWRRIAETYLKLMADVDREHSNIGAPRGTQ